MKLTFDYYHNLEQVDLYLCNPDGRELFPLPGKSRNLTLRFNDLSELTFEVGSKVTLSNNTVVDLEAYDYIQTKRLVYATNIGWFQISAVDEHDNGVVKYKSIAAESYQSVLKNKGFISEERVYCFYNPNDPRDERYDSTNDGSIPSVLGQWSKQLGIKQALGQGLAEPDVPYDDWTVTYVNPSLIYTGTGSKCRTFKESVTFGYDWIVNDVEEAFGVIVLFDFMYKTIHVMTPDEVAQKVNVIYTFNNFMKSIDVEEKSDDIVTVLSCNGDNCDITGVNPTGTNYICDFSYFMDKVNYRWMSAELINKLEQWKSDCDAEKSTYEEHIKDLRTLYKSKTEKETLLQEMSLILTDLKTVVNKRTAFESEDAGVLCGIVMAETVAKGANSIKEGTKYYTAKFSGDTIVKAYQFQPNYNREMRRWEWDNSGESTSGTVNDIVASNLSDTNTSGRSYWYFSDVNDGSSYCKLKSAVTVNKDTASSTYYCSGFERYIAYVSPLYTYPMPRRADIPSYDSDTRAIEDVFYDLKSGNLSLTEIIDKYGFSGKQFSCSVYMDSVSEWVNLYEKKVSGLNSKIRGLNRDIASVSSKLEAISSRLNILRYMSDTPALLRELNCYWIEGDYTNENIAVLEQTTPEEELDLSNELLDSGYIELSKVCQPRFSFSVESVDATKQYEFRAQMRLLELGKIITIEKDEGIWYYPALLEISINLDNSEEFSMSFANALRLDDWGYTYADLISDASSTSRQVSANWQDILAYSKERAEITSIIKDPLDVTLRASFANMVNQEFTVDNTGILGRKRLSETSEDFEDEQVRLINNLLIFTDDNWETAKTALGKIHYTDENGNPVTSYGLIAETIIGSLIMGERLKIINKNSTIELGAEGITVRKEDGTEVFSAKPDGTMFVRSYASQTALNSVKSLVEVNAGNIALIVENGGVKGSVVVEAINGQSAVKIKADVVDIEGRVNADYINALGLSVYDTNGNLTFMAKGNACTVGQLTATADGLLAASVFERAGAFKASMKYTSSGTLTVTNYGVASAWNNTVYTIPQFASKMLLSGWSAGDEVFVIYTEYVPTGNTSGIDVVYHHTFAEGDDTVFVIEDEPQGFNRSLIFNHKGSKECNIYTYNLMFSNEGLLGGAAADDSYGGTIYGGYLRITGDAMWTGLGTDDSASFYVNGTGVLKAIIPDLASVELYTSIYDVSKESYVSCETLEQAINAINTTLEDLWYAISKLHG